MFKRLLASVSAVALGLLPAAGQSVYPPVIPQSGTNLLPLNNTWTGTNTFTGLVNGSTLLFPGDASGATNSDSAFVSWIAQLASTGATGIVPPGNFKFANQNLFDTSGAQTTGIKIIGSGCNVSKFTYTGSSTGPAFRVGQDKAVQLLILSAITSGSGYVVGTYTNVPLTGGSGTGAQATISVQNTAMSTQTITTGGSYTNGTYTNVPFYPITGSGSSATANVTVSGGTVTSVTIVGNGINYHVGDTVGLVSTYLGGTGSGYVGTVTAVTPGVAGVAITAIGTGYLVGDVVSASNTNLGGSGSGFAVTIRGDNFYTRISGINFISSNNGPTLQWGRNDMLDSINGPYSDNCVNNSYVGSNSIALRVNSVITSAYFSNIADGPAYNSGYAACDFRGAAILNIYGSCSNASIGMHMTSTAAQYEYANVFHAIDSEVTGKVLVIDNAGGVGGSVTQNIWEGGQWAYSTCAIDATIGYRNEINNGNLGGVNDFCGSDTQGMIILGATYNPFTLNTFTDLGISAASPSIRMPNAGANSSGIQFITNTSNVAVVQETAAGDQYTICYVSGCSEYIKTSGGGVYGYNGTALLFAFSSAGVLTLYNSGATHNTQYYTDTSGNGALVVSTTGASYYRTLTGAGGTYVDQINGATTTIESSSALYTTGTMSLGQSGQPWDISYTRKYNLVTAAPPTASSCGTSPIVAASSTNQGGYVTFGTGGSTTACTITFANAYPNSALCTVSWNSPPGAIILWMPNLSNTYFTVNTSADASGKSFSYSCTGN